jgi:hypothetical protein
VCVLHPQVPSSLGPRVVSRGTLVRTWSFVRWCSRRSPLARRPRATSSWRRLRRRWRRCRALAALAPCPPRPADADARLQLILARLVRRPAFATVYGLWTIAFPYAVKAFHYGFIPFVLFLGVSTSNPKPKLMDLLTPM